MALTRRGGCVAAKVPSPPRMLALKSPSSSALDEVPRSELSRPMMGTIWVSLLKGPTAAAPK